MKNLETVKVLGPSKAWVNTKRSMLKEWPLKRFYWRTHAPASMLIHWKKRSVYVRKELKSHKIDLGHQTIFVFAWHVALFLGYDSLHATFFILFFREIIVLTVLLIPAKTLPLNSTSEYTAPLTSFSATWTSFPEIKSTNNGIIRRPTYEFVWKGICRCTAQSFFIQISNLYMCLQTYF